jgi:hypothetical protein
MQKPWNILVFFYIRNALDNKIFLLYRIIINNNTLMGFHYYLLLITTGSSCIGRHLNKKYSRLIR